MMLSDETKTVLGYTVEIYRDMGVLDWVAE